MSELTPSQRRAIERRMIHQSFLRSSHDPIHVPHAPPVIPFVMQVFLAVVGFLTLIYLLFGWGDLIAFIAGH